MESRIRPILALVFLACSSLLVAQTSDLFISEYIEGGSYNKAIEIYNGTGSSIDLSDYAVELYTNGSPTVSQTLTLSGTLVDGDVYVIAHTSADSVIQDEADVLSGSVANFNGDDAVALRKNGALLDVIGVIGEDPGSEWGSGLLSTQDNTLRRKSTVCAGNTTFDLDNEWDGYAKDTFDGLGSHSADCGTPSYTPIYDIQYTTDPGGDSPLKDQADVTTEGIVTALFSGGYFIQDLGGAWHGVWVADATNLPSRGDRLHLTGTISEIDAMTGLTSVTDYQVLSSGNTLPAAASVATGDVSLEQWEGVLVQVENVTVTNADINGDWLVDDNSGDARIGAKGSYAYSPTLDDELDKVAGPVDVVTGNFVVQPRDDDDIVETPEIQLVINEILADPDGTNGDANGDGIVDTGDDEFVEIVNAADADVDISGWTLADQTSVRHTFPAGTIVPAGGAIVVFGGGTPTGDFGGAIVQTAGSLGLNNTGDTVTLNDGTSDVVSFSYGSEANANQSITREPDVTGGDPFVKHTDAVYSNGALFSPGCKIDGGSFLATPIHSIQGNNDTSPLDGQSGILVEGVVTADFQGADHLSGFFIQAENHKIDADDATSEGLFIYDVDFGVDVHVGDLVRVTGTVTEHYERTEFENVTDVFLIRTTAVPPPTEITLPVSSVSDFEAYEGMLVIINQQLTVSGTYKLADYGEVELSVDGRLFTPTAIVDPGPDAVAQQDVNDRRRIQLDDGNENTNPDPVPYLTADNTLRLGSTIPSLTGVLDYSYERYEIHPTETVIFIDDNPRTAAPSLTGVLRAASFNVYNFFNGDGQGGGFPTSRGADTFADFSRQREKLINAMTTMNADVFGLVELENDGFGQYSAIQDLVNGLNDASSSTYSFIDPGLSQIGTDAITCGIIYKPAMLTPVGNMAILDNSVDPSFDATNRPSLAQTFQDTSGEIFTFAVNHFRSKRSACPGDEDQGDGQGHCNQTRVDAANALTTWLAGDPTSSHDSDFMIVGDLNAYTNEDPVTAITDAGYTLLAEQGADAYSYVYKAQSGSLDHTFVSASLASQVTGTTIWHINADEPVALGYDSDNPAGLYDSGAYRSSDHDPIIVGLDLEPIAIELSLFTAVFEDGVVSLHWTTENEINTAGFNILRSAEKEGVYVKVNNDLILSQGDSGKGADYDYIDGAGIQTGYYKLESVMLDGYKKQYGPFAVTVVNAVEQTVLPKEFVLYANYPNPFNPSTIIRFDVPATEHVTIRIYDVRGRHVRTLVNRMSDAGSFEIKWYGLNEDGRAVAAGLYFYEMRAGDFVDVRKMIFVK